MSSFFSLESFLQMSLTLWYQILFILILTIIIKYHSIPLQKLDFLAAWLFTGMYTHWYERQLVAPVKVIAHEIVKPDKNIAIDRAKLGYITALSPIETWLCHTHVDHCLFYDYELDYQQLKEALSRLLAKIPILGGVFCEIDRTTMGIDHTNPQIDFMFVESDLAPSVNFKDYDKPNWFMKYSRGGNTSFPYPKGKFAFRVTLTHYPNPKKNGEKASLLTFGGNHALYDAEGFFIVMNCWANEVKGIKYELPNLDRSKFNIKPEEFKDFKPNTTILGKNFELSTKLYPWVKCATAPPRHWIPYEWKFSAEQMETLKQTALKGSKGEELKKMFVSTNDIITALMWKLRGLLNRDYEFKHPVIGLVVINTRPWLAERCGKNYIGAPLAFLTLTKTRRELIDADFSQVVYWVREKVASIKKEDIENDLNMYAQIKHNGIHNLYRYHTRWAGDTSDFKHGRFIQDRDFMISNVQKLNMNVDFGKGDNSFTAFSFNENISHLTYFQKAPDGKGMLFWSSVPIADLEFYQNNDITTPLDWEALKHKYARETKRWIMSYPSRRVPIINFSALWDNRPDSKFITW